MLAKIVISQYPITKDIRSNLEDNLDGEIEFMVVTHIAHTGYLNLIKQLRQIHCNELYVYTPMDDQQFALPILRFMSVFIPANSRYVLGDDSVPALWGARDIIGDIGWVLWSLITGLFSLVAAIFYLAFLRCRRQGAISFKEAIESRRILYFRPTLWQGLKEGGAISHSRGVVQGFLKLGYRVDCFADSEFMKFDGQSCSFKQIRPRKAYILPRELNHFNFQWHFISQVRKLIGEVFQGIIYQRLSVGGFAGVILSRLWKVPLVIEYNGSEVWLAKNWGNRFFFDRTVAFVENEILSNAHLLVTVSEPLKRDLETRGVEPERIVVCPNGVDIDLFSPENITNEMRRKTRTRFGFSDEDIIFTFVGTFGVWHGATVFADSILKILEEFEDTNSPLIDRLRFLFIGNGAEYGQVSQRLISAKKSGRVTMTGLVEHADVVSLLDISDVCLSPTIENQDGSEFFGSPTKLFEYLAAGKPIIASEIGQIKDVMRGSPNFQKINIDSCWSLSSEESGNAVGILVPPGDSEILKTAILALAGDDKSRLTMAQNARVQAKSKHSWAIHVQSLISTLSEVAERTLNRRVTLLINALHSKSGGGVTYIRNMMPLLASSEKLDVHIVLQASQMELFGKSLAGVEPHFIDDQEGLVKLIYAEQVQLPKIARTLGADVIFSPANYGPLATTKAVILLRNSLDVAFVDHRIRKLVYWLLLSLATIVSIVLAREVIAVSEYARNSSLRGFLRGLRKKVTIIPHGISNTFDDVYNQNSEENYILSVSDIYVQKNLHTLVRSFAKLISVRSGLKLKVAGKPIDKDYFDRIVRLIDELKISDHVEFLGHVETHALKELYKGCRVFVFPSTVETFGNPLAEAMACGCSIVCSDAAAMPEVAGDAAIYVNPKNHIAFYDAMKRMLDDETLRAEYSAKAKERAKRFSWETTGVKTVETILRAANRG